MNVARVQLRNSGGKEMVAVGLFRKTGEDKHPTNHAAQRPVVPRDGNPPLLPRAVKETHFGAELNVGMNPTNHDRNKHYEKSLYKETAGEGHQYLDPGVSFVAEPKSVSDSGHTIRGVSAGSNNQYGPPNRFTQDVNKSVAVTSTARFVLLCCWWIWLYTSAAYLMKIRIFRSCLELWIYLRLMTSAQEGLPIVNMCFFS